MSDQLTVNRRRVIELSGVGTALAVAGCTSLDGSDAEGDDRQVTVIIEPDQEELQQRQAELQEDDDVSDQELQLELQQIQQELLEDAFDNVQTEFDELGLNIEDSLQNQALLVSGPATTLIDGLDVEGVEALLAGSLFEQAQEQQEAQQEAQQGQEQPPIEDEETEDEETEDEETEDEETEETD